MLDFFGMSVTVVTGAVRSYEPRAAVPTWIVDKDRRSYKSSVL
jgi:hypothetical protein